MEESLSLKSQPTSFITQLNSVSHGLPLTEPQWIYPQSHLSSSVVSTLEMRSAASSMVNSRHSILDLFSYNSIYCFSFPGVQLTLCMQSIHYIRKMHSTIGRKQFYICYSLALVLMNSIGLGCNTLYGQFVWIEQRSSSPGGPAEYFLANTTWWVNTFGTCSALVANLMSDGLLVRHRDFS